MLRDCSRSETSVPLSHLQDNGFQHIVGSRLPGNTLRACMALLEDSNFALFMGGMHTAGVLARLDMTAWTWTHLTRPSESPSAPVCGVMMNWNATTGEDEELFVMGDIVKTHIFSIKVVFFCWFYLTFCLSLSILTCLGSSGTIQVHVSISRSNVLFWSVLFGLGQKELVSVTYR